MSILVRFTNTPPTTTEQYDDSIQRLQQVGDFPPDGLECHVCFVADGNIRVTEIWEPREQLNAFAERLMPVLAQMGVGPGEPEIFRDPQHRQALDAFARLQQAHMGRPG